MSDQVTNKSAVAQQDQVPAVEMALPTSTSTSHELLRRIAMLLFILVAGLLTVFGYYASSICITVILAAFLAILFDPVVVLLEKLHLPRSVAAAAIVLAGMGMTPRRLSCYRLSPWDHYLAALRAGAFDYIACPPDFAETERIVWSAIGHMPESPSGPAH